MVCLPNHLDGFSKEHLVGWQMRIEIHYFKPDAHYACCPLEAENTRVLSSPPKCPMILENPFHVIGYFSSFEFNIKHLANSILVL